jgi:hypothetical protein
MKFAKELQDKEYEMFINTLPNDNINIHQDSDYFEKEFINIFHCRYICQFNLLLILGQVRDTAISHT